MNRSRHPFYTALMVQRTPHTALLNPVYEIDLMSGRGWFSKATKKVGSAIKSTKKFVKQAIPIVKQVYNDPAVQKLLNNTPLGNAIDKGINVAQTKYSTVIKPYQDLYQDAKATLNAANQLSALPVVGPAIGYALQPTNDLVNNIGDPLNDTLTGNGARRGRSRVRGKGVVHVPMSSIIASGRTSTPRRHHKRT